jgi:hypothetical protein
VKKPSRLISPNRTFWSKSPSDVRTLHHSKFQCSSKLSQYSTRCIFGDLLICQRFDTRTSISGGGSFLTKMTVKSDFPEHLTKLAIATTTTRTSIVNRKELELPNDNNCDRLLASRLVCAVQPFCATCPPTGTTHHNINNTCVSTCWSHNIKDTSK